MLRSRHVLAVLVCTLCLLVSSVAPTGVMTPRALAAPPILATPNSLSATVPLGERHEDLLTLTNASASEDAALHVYEAFAPTSATVISSAVAPALRRVALPAQTTRVDPQIARRMAAAPNGQTDFVVFLNDQVDLSPAYQVANWRDRGWLVYRLLHDHAEQSQAGLRTLLSQRGVSYTPFWIVNALEVHGSQSDLQALTGRAEVATIQAKQTIAVDPLNPQPAADTAALSQCNPNSGDSNKSTCWNIRTLGADRVWNDFGVTGQGITVGNIDTGVNYAHVALAQHYRGYVGPGTFDHNYNWFDPQGVFTVPTDNNGHGTHTMGSMVAQGNGTADQPSVGVAPGAHWIAAQGCDGSSCSNADLIAAAQWMLAPTDLSGKNPRPDLRPQIINNSWSGSSNEDWYAGYTAAWRAAGIFPVFAGGNISTGATCGSIKSPGDYADVVGVGATDATDTIANFSARGPTADNRLKPDVSAPGTQIVSTYTGTTTKYAFLQGTSMAAPQVAGVVALLWSANPSLIGNYDATYALLTGTAKRISDTRCQDAEGAPNNLYGYGRIQAYNAVANAEVDVPWLSLGANQFTIPVGETRPVSVTFDAAKVPGPGTYTARILVNGNDLSQDPQVITVTLTVPSDTNQARLTGTIHDRTGGAPLTTAHLSVVDGASVRVDRTGVYSITLPTRELSYTLVASAIGYLSVTNTVVLTTPVTLNIPFSLTTDLQSLLVNTQLLSATLDIGQSADLTTTIKNTGTQALSYTASIPSTDYGIWPSDDPRPSFVHAPANALMLSLTDDGTSDDSIPLGFEISVFGSLYNSVYINANGLIGLGPKPDPVSFMASSCEPTKTTSGAALLPFYADLDPSQGGEVSYAYTDEGLIITYNQVPLHQKTITADPSTYTFQVVIAPSGRIIYRYDQLGALPASLVVGIQQNSAKGQIIDCGSSATIQAGRSLELRPQPSTDLWAGLLSPSASVAPNETATITLVLLWMRPKGSNQPLRGDVLIESDDPRLPRVRIPFTLVNRPAPFEMLFPIAAH